MQQSLEQSRATPLAALERWLDVESLLPACYRRYGPAVSQALLFFLERLEPARRKAIIRAQLALGAGSSAEERIVTLLRHCPTLHKLGQAVARDRRLSAALRHRLQRLETLPPTLSITEVTALLDRELGNAALTGIELGELPLAEASVAIVTPFRFRHAESDSPNEGVFKMLKPGVEAALAEELALWSQLGALLDEICEAQQLPAIDYRETLASVVDLLRREVRLEQEQRHLRAAYQRYADSSTLRVPRLLAPCSPRITAMERVYGRKVTDVTDPSAKTPVALAEVLLRELLARPFWDVAPVAVFHGDPHAGNLLVDPDGRVVLLDWSLTASLDKRERIAIVQMIMGAMSLDSTRLRRALAALSIASKNESALSSVMDRALHRVRLGEPPGLAWLTDLLDQCLLQGCLKLPPHLTVFRKAILTLNGVLADLSAQHRTDTVLFESGIQQLLSEWPSRFTAAMSSRNYGSHVSSEDLVQMWASLPVTAGTYVLGGWCDAVDLLRSTYFGSLQGRCSRTSL